MSREINHWIIINHKSIERYDEILSTTLENCVRYMERNSISLMAKNLQEGLSTVNIKIGVRFLVISPSF